MCINFHISWDSVGPIRQSYRSLFGEIRRSAEPTRRHRWHYNISLFSEAAFIFKYEFTASAMRSSTYVFFMPLQLSCQPTPFCPLRVALVASRRVALIMRTDASLSSYHPRRVLWGKHWISDA